MVTFKHSAASPAPAMSLPAAVGSPLPVRHLARALKLGAGRAASPAALLVAAGAAGLLVLSVTELPREQRAASLWVEHTLEVMEAATTLEAGLATMTAEARGFVVTRAPENAALFEAAVPQVAADLADLRSLVADNPEQVAALDRLHPFIDARIAVLRFVVRHLAAGDEAGAAPAMHARAGRLLIERIGGAIDAIKARERQLLAVREAAAHRATVRSTGALLGCGLILATILLARIAVALRRATARHELETLSRLNSDLEAQVAARTTELAASMARQRGYFDDSPIGLCVLRPAAEGQFVFDDLNPAAASICGRPRDGVIGRTLREVWPDTVALQTEDMLAVCIASRQTMRYVVGAEAGSQPHTLDIQLTALLDPAGEACEVMACVQDVTEQRALQRRLTEQAEQQAEAAEREMALFRSSPDILFVASVDDTVAPAEFVYEAFSPALERLTGLRAEDLAGCSPERGLAPEIAASMLPDYRTCVAERRIITWAGTLPLPIGARDFEGSLAPVVNPASGRVVRIVGALRDVTERNRLEAERGHGQKMEAIGRLAAGVAHDFNNVLQGIVGGLELVLTETLEGTPTHKFAAVALNSAVRGAYLTHHLLSYARRQALQPRPVVLLDLLSNLQEVLARTLDPQIVVTMQVAAGTPPVLADPSQLETALLNLAINAADAMAGGGTLGIATDAAGEEGKRWVTIMVSDTGCGMDQATLAQAVEPFFTTKGLNGTGLGLSMVQGFVEQSGGQMRISSAPGDGTRIELRLPRADSEQPKDLPQDAAAPLRAVRILLVDDAPDVLMTTGAFLENMGFLVVRAGNGTAALGQMEGGAGFDVLVTDYAMPDLKGTELIVQCRAIQPNLPAVITTGFAALDEGTPLPDGTITLHKPYHRQTLLAALRQVLPPA